VWHARGVIELPEPEAPEAPLRLVVGAAVVDDLETPTTLLAARRTLPARLAGGWELPGGKVEPGEEPEAALHRELAEELGVQVQLGAEVTPPEGDGWPLPPAHRMRVWLVRIVAGEPVPLEDHDALRVLGPGEWLDVEWLPADVPVVRALSERTTEPRAQAG
jgi:8-oxo-dGTP diphosphatase